MKKVVTINLGGNAYQIDEDGYDVLQRYLASARARLGGNPDLDEIMADLELAIADKASRYLGPNKTVVSGAEIDALIEEMGPVDAPPGEDDVSAGSGSGAAAASDNEREGWREPRRLYRLTGRDEKMVAGVCGGLAAYLGTDVSILRILLIVLVFVSAGAVLIGYLLMILIIPAAETPEQRAAAYGLPFDAQDVIDRAKSKFSEFRDHRESRRQRRAERHYRGRQSTSAGHDLFRWVLAAIVIGLGIVVALALFDGLFGMFGVHFGPWGPGFYRGPPWLGLLMSALVLALILWVLGARSRDGSSFFGSFLVVFAILCLIWFATYTFGFIPRFADGAPHFLLGWME
jgi:phage shock protein PspC (stress-responsive transcriptional regulator)